MSEEECPVCMEKKNRKEIFKCGHSMCVRCSKTWFYEKTTCPMCRAHVKLSRRSVEYLKKIRQHLQTRENVDVANLMMSVEEWRERRNDTASKEFLMRVEQVVKRYSR
jgi:hypothetical protein